VIHESPTGRQWDELLAEVASLVDDLKQHSRIARARSTERIIDGYPTSSMPESSIASGRLADPTVQTVEKLAGGKLTIHHDGSETTTPDHWKGPKDPIAQAIRNMESEALDARNRLRGAVASLRKALPAHSPDRPREQCVSCGTPRDIAGEKDWNQAEASCGACVRRKRRYGERVGAR
jgi:hypothetical protein